MCETIVDEWAAKWAAMPTRITAYKRVVRINLNRPRRPVLEVLSKKTYVDYNL